MWWHRGRCLSYGEGVAFWALAEMVRQRLGIAEEDSADVAAGKLAAGLDLFVPDPDERAYVGVRLGRLLGVGSAEGAAAMSREELSLSTGREDYFGLFNEIAYEAAFAGVVLVCADNNVPAPTYPAQFSSVISVAAHDGQDPFGIDANPAPPTDFGAPGIDVRVPWLSGSTIVTTGNSFAARLQGLTTLT